MAYTITNTPNTYHKWNIGSYSGNIAIGDLMTGATSGAQGMLINISLNFLSVFNAMWFVLLTPGTPFQATGETVNFSSGGQCAFSNGGETYNASHNSIWVDGVLDAASGSSLTKAVGNVGEYGGIDTGSNTTEFVDETETDINVTNGSHFGVGDIIQIDDERMLVTGIASNTLTVTRRVAFSDRAEHANGTDIYRVSIHVTDADRDFEKYDYIKIDNEYFLVLLISDSNNTLFCTRAEHGTAKATHSSATAINVMDRSLGYEIYNASNTGGWGYESLVKNRPVFDCNIFLGRPDQSNVTICHTSEEVIETNGMIFTAGKDATDYSKFQIGCGIEDVNASSADGSIIITRGDIFHNGGVANTRFGYVNAHASNVSKFMSWDGGLIQRCNVKLAKQADYGYDLAGANCFSYSYSTNNTKWTDIVAATCSYNPGSANMVFNRLLAGVVAYGLYFLQSQGAEPSIYGLTFEMNTDEVFSFVDGGNKYIVNPGPIDITRWSGFWSSTTYHEQYTVDMKVQTPDRTGNQNASVKAWNNVPTQIINTTTGADGTITQQVETRNEKFNNGANVNYEPIKYVIIKSGWQEDIYEDSHDEQKNYVITLKNRMFQQGDDPI